jgi:ABC-type transport system involved in multi-copper enzyme maturation permease subunit
MPSTVIGGDADARPDIVQLTVVELRKMVDTRSGFWFLLVSAVATIAAVLVVGYAGNADDHVLSAMLEIAVIPASILLPIAGILLVTSEWSQRTAMTTFALVPNRSRVLASKLAAGIILGLLALALGVIVAVVGTAFFAPDTGDAWSLSAELFGQHVLGVVSGMIGGFAFGALVLRSAPAIVAYFVAPSVIIVLAQIEGLRGSLEWIDGSQSLPPLTDHVLSGSEMARVVTTLVVWSVVPLVIGWWRIKRDEIS